MPRKLIFALLFQLLFAFQMIATGRDGQTESEPEKNSLGRDVVSDLRSTMKAKPYLARVYPLIFRRGEAEQMIPELDQDFSFWEGRRIADIQIHQREVFNVSDINGTIPLFRSIPKFGNWLQPQTRMRSITNNLFFAEGDSLIPGYLIANMHYLYDLGLYSEVEFDIRELADNELGIDVSLREKFFVQFSGKFMERDELRLRLMDRNFLCFGHSMLVDMYVDPSESELFGWESTYTHPNIRGSFFKGEFHFEDMPKRNAVEFALNRDFRYPLHVDYGGISFSYSDDASGLYSSRVRKNDYSAWYAKAFRNLEYPAYLYGAVSFLGRQGLHSPQGSQWQDALISIASAGYSSPEYIFIPGLSSFLDSDYVPKGTHLSVLTGYELAESGDRSLVGIRAGAANLDSNGHYLSGQLAYDQYLKHGNTDQSFIALEPMYISPQREFGSFDGRGLIFARAVFSKKAYSSQLLKLSEGSFYRDGTDLGGTDLLSICLEEDLNTNYQILGFQVSAFAFLDLAFVREVGSQSVKTNSLFAQGTGIRLRNASLIWDFIELRVGLETLNSTKTSLVFSLTVNPTRRLQDFSGRQPIPYRKW